MKKEAYASYDVAGGNDGGETHNAVHPNQKQIENLYKYLPRAQFYSMYKVRKSYNIIYKEADSTKLLPPCFYTYRFFLTFFYTNLVLTTYKRIIQFDAVMRKLNYTNSLLNIHFMFGLAVSPLIFIIIWNYALSVIYNVFMVRNKV